MLDRVMYEESRWEGTESTNPARKREGGGIDATQHSTYRIGDEGARGGSPSCIRTYFPHFLPFFVFSNRTGSLLACSLGPSLTHALSFARSFGAWSRHPTTTTNTTTTTTTFTTATAPRLVGYSSYFCRCGLFVVHDSLPRRAL